MAPRDATTRGTTGLSDIQRLKEMVRQEWDAASKVAAYRRWHVKHAPASRALTDTIVQVAQVRPGMKVLDLASSSGEPALTLAGLVGPSGKVTATDLSPGMLAIADENARLQGLTNLTAEQADAESLPFPDRTFDLVTCRLGIMFCPDPGRALRETYQVLKPGGRAAFLAWGPPTEQAFFTTTVGVLVQYVQLMPPEPGAPTPFAFWQARALASAMERAGFERVREEYRSVSISWPGPPEEYWEWCRDTSTDLLPIVGSLQSEQREQIIGGILGAMRQYYDGERLNLPVILVVASGVR